MLAGLKLVQAEIWPII